MLSIDTLISLKINRAKNPTCRGGLTSTWGNTINQAHVHVDNKSLSCDSVAINQKAVKRLVMIKVVCQLVFDVTLTYLLEYLNMKIDVYRFGTDAIAMI